MSSKQRGLGRGLEALIPTTATSVSAGDLPPPRASRPAEYEGPDGREPDRAPAAYFGEVPIDAVTRNPRQPRVVFDEEELAELALSIQEVGLLQPVVVRPLGEGRYELVMGERRWRAARLAGMQQIAAIIRRTPDDVMLRDALLENLHRAQLNPLEEAAAYQQLLDDFGCSHDILAQRLGRSRPHISNTVRLLRLSAAVQRRVAAGVLSAGHARALLAVDDASAQDALAARVVAEGISVRGLEELVALGPASPAAPRRARTSEIPVELAQVADLLSEHLDTRCRVEPGRRRGRLVVEFASAADLYRIVTAISPNLLK
jgi:ParB family chromosome partitioning protein